jgi:hypothetical protein
VLVSFIDGGNRSTRRKPPTCRKSLTKIPVQSVPITTKVVSSNPAHVVVTCQWFSRALRFESGVKNHYPTLLYDYDHNLNIYLIIYIFYRTPNCTFLNVGKIKPKCYSKPFHIGILGYIYARISRAKFHFKVE